MGEVCGLHGRDKNRGNSWGRKRPEDLDIDGAIIKMELKELV